MTTTTTTTTADVRDVGRAFLEAVITRDEAATRALLADDVAFRMLTPGGVMSEDDGDAAAARFTGWFGGGDPFEVLSTTLDLLAGRAVIGYRARLRWPEGWHAIEQHLMLDVTGPVITRIDLLCSGFRPIPAPGPDGTHAFDAGSLGCGDGLAGEFRRRVHQIPVGDVLTVTTRDPAAKEDLPPLARMMGHVVRSIEPTDDGRLLISVERGR